MAPPAAVAAAGAAIEALATERLAAAPAPHLVALPGGEGWALWRCACLRGTGFPLAPLLRLGSPAALAALAERRRAEAELEAAFAAALAAVDGALRELRREGAWEEAARRRPLLKLQRALGKRRLPEPAAGGAAAAELAALAAGQERLAGARRELERCLAAEAERTSRELEQMVSDERFQEALLWQNRQAFHHLRESLLGKPDGPRNSRRRQNEELVASYLQRYCAKNDTIGFFGPVGWAELSHQGPAVVVRAGPRLLAERTVFFEAWGVDALARTLAADRAIQPWIAPRLLPFIRLEGDTLLVPGQTASRLQPGQAALLRACDGTRSARQLAGELREAATPGLRNEREVFTLLDYMRKTGIVEWELAVPVEPYALAALRRQLEAIGDEAVRRRAMAAVAELEAARAEVAAAAGRPVDLDQALGRFESTFTRLAGASPTRAPGQTYASRTLLFEDCRRDLDLTLGPGVLAALGPPLALLLDSARWYTFRAAELCRPIFRRLYDELARATGSPAVEAIELWYRLQPLLFAETSRLSDAALPEFQRRWAELLPFAPGERRASFRAAALSDGVRAAFAAPHAGWAVGRYHSPDVLIAAASVEAVERGDFQLVLGEIHMGANTLNTWVFMTQHPQRESVARALAADLPEPRVVPISGKHWPGLTTRTQIAFVPEHDYRLASTHGAAGVDPGRVLPISSIVIEPAQGRLVARTRDGRLRRDVLDLFADALTFMIGSSFKLLPATAHTPRVTIDRLVVARETWRFAAGELPFAGAEGSAERFAAVRRWADEQGLPRFVFVKSPVEKKPFCVDLTSPVLIELLAKTARRTAAARAAEPLQVTEMLPDPGQAWLPDAAGQRYLCELRLVALDLAGRPPAGPGGSMP
jgi:hypothetical protein